ncbi:MAG: crossover junction endodeoxyribonuclease RuvC [Thermomicrobium sp.]|nr:crossover junction endodeoxyribonuclease RuvC [Thermomicrobium sp.]
MRILGIDPGTALLGYGLVAATEPPEALTYGVVRTEATASVEQRLVRLYEELSRLLDAWRPDVVALEQLFFARNVTTALAVGQARGVVLLLCGQRGLPVVEYTPAQVKQAIGGYGKAAKRQMQEMVKLLLRLPDIPQPDDAADALAIALCHLHNQRPPWLRVAENSPP